MTLTTVGQGAPYIYQLQADNNGIYIPNFIALSIAGQVFTSTTGLQTSGGAILTGLSVFNPLASTKTLIVFSIDYAVAAGAQSRLMITTTDPALTSPDTPLNNRVTSALASSANATFQNTAVTPQGTTFRSTGNGGNTITNVISNNEVIVCPAGSGVLMLINTSTNAWNCTMSWAEI